MTFPILLGIGRRLYGPTSDKSRWRLAEATTYGDGVLLTIHRRAH